MKLKAIHLAIAYCILYISFTLFFYFTQQFKPFNYVYLGSMALILPFVLITVKIQRENTYGGYISSKDAFREGMKFIVLLTFLLIVFQTFFYFMGWKEFKAEFLPALIRESVSDIEKLGKKKFTEAEIQKSIQEELNNITLFKEITFTFFRCIFAGFFSSFLAAIFLKRSKKA